MILELFHGGELLFTDGTSVVIPTEILSVRLRAISVRDCVKGILSVLQVRLMSLKVIEKILRGGERGNTVDAFKTVSLARHERLVKVLRVGSQRRRRGVTPVADGATEWLPRRVRLQMNLQVITARE